MEDDSLEENMTMLSGGYDVLGCATRVRQILGPSVAKGGSMIRPAALFLHEV